MSAISWNLRLNVNDGCLEDFRALMREMVAATQAEPGLELAWWALLRTRTAAEDYAGATEALTELEDRFGHLLIPQQLRRDPFLRVLIDQQEYKDWRAARDAAAAADSGGGGGSGACRRRSGFSRWRCCRRTER